MSHSLSHVFATSVSPAYARRALFGLALCLPIMAFVAPNAHAQNLIIETGTHHVVHTNKAPPQSQTAWVPVRVVDSENTSKHASRNGRKSVYRVVDSSGNNRLSKDYAPHPLSKFVTESGTRPSRLHSAPVMDEVSLQHALQLVVPLGFRVLGNGVVDSKADTSVHINAPKPWVLALGDLAKQAHFVAHIDWSNRDISFAPPPKPKPKPKPAKPSSKAGAAIAKRTCSSHCRPADPNYRVSNTKFKAATTPIPGTAPHAALPSWTLDPKKTLRENVQDWSNKAGWTLVWKAADYPVIGQTVFYGDFDSNTGPIATIIRGYQDSEQPLVADLTTRDHVIYIHNKYADRSIVPNTDPSQLAPQLYDHGVAPTVSMYGEDLKGANPNVADH